MSALDLNILPLLRRNGQDLPDLPGLYAVAPPRRVARGRAPDNLVLYLELSGGAPLQEEQQNQVLVRLAQKFFKTPGTVTAALKATADTLNEILLERNLQSSTGGRQSIGLLTQVVIHGEAVYLATSGPGHAFLIRPQGSQHFHDPQGAGRGLGLSRTTLIRFFQIALQPNDFLLLSHQPSETWLTEGGPVAPGQGMESMRRRLLQKAGEDLSAVLIQIQAGTGRMRLLRLKPAFQNMARPAEDAISNPKESLKAFEPGEQSSEAKPVIASPVVEENKPKPTAYLQEGVEQPGATPRSDQPPVIALETPPKSPPSKDQTAKPPLVSTISSPSRDVGHPATSISKPIQPPKKTPRSSFLPAIGRFFSLIFKAIQAFNAAFGSALRQVLEGLRGLLRRILPDETLLNVSPTTMVFLALAIPLVISVIGGMVYIERGQALQYQTYYQQAFQTAEEAAVISDPAELRKAWQSTLESLNQAELYRVTEQSQALRNQAQGNLDRMDAVERLDFQPAFSENLGKSTQITRMAATATELYLLNTTQGNIQRAMLTPNGYALDAQFFCGPAAAPGSIGPLIDLALLPAGISSGATVIGIDLNGNLIYCTPGDDPDIAVLAPPPVNFGNPKAFTLDSGDLYLIDPPKKSVWVYRNMVTDQPPNQFLGDITSFMVDVIGIAANLDDVYLLHSNGKMTKCTFGSIENVPTRCEDPLLFTDTRPGRQGGEVIPDALFAQIYFSPPPDPSLYMLDPKNQAIYHFSLRLTLDRQYRTLRSLSDKPASAFAISPTRLVFMAFDDQVFYAALP